MAEIDPDCREFISISETIFGNFRVDKFTRDSFPEYLAFKRMYGFKTKFFDTREEAIIFSRMLFPGVKIIVSVPFKKFIDISWKFSGKNRFSISNIREYFRNVEDLSI